MCPCEGQLLRARLGRSIKYENRTRQSGCSPWKAGNAEALRQAPRLGSRRVLCLGFDSRVELLEGFQLRRDVFQLIFRNDPFGCCLENKLKDTSRVEMCARELQMSRLERGRGRRVGVQAPIRVEHTAGSCWRCLHGAVH